MQNKSMFEKLAKGIPQQERIELLKKLQSISNNEIHVSETIIESDAQVSLDDISIKFKSENILFRIFFIIKSFFSSISVENLYNDHLVSKKAKEVEKNYPDILDYRHGFLLTGFYNRLLELKNAADFFKSGITSYEENPGEFYVFLGTLVVPKISEKIDTEVNPYNLSFDSEITNDVRAGFIRRLDDILQNMGQTGRNKLYIAIQNLEWFKAFVKFPYERMISKFISIVSGTTTCPLDAVSSELNLLAKIMSNGKKIYPEVLEAMYLLSAHAQEQLEAGVDIETHTTEYVTKSIEHIGAIKLFLQTVPIKALAAISEHSYFWINEHLSGVEDWFIKYKAQWRKNFDKKWNSWLKDKRKYQTKQQIEAMLSVSDYPVLPNRPWRDVWGGIPFLREYTLGFLNAFYEKIYPEYNRLFKILMIEGAFVNKDNRVDYTDTFNALNHVGLILSEFNEKLSFKGIYGSSFSNIANESLKTVQGQSKLNSLMLNIESEGTSILTAFNESASKMTRILGGITNVDTTSIYDIITNLSAIQGKSNMAFRQQVEEARKNLLQCLEIIIDLESIELSLK
ncbi:MAG: hypothetical protein GX220_01350 [Treponema sp.]|nr:hypothetical protein [Treponema sp.]